MAAAAADVWPLAVVKDFVLIGQHTCPRNAMKEMDQLYAVVKDVRKKWKVDVSQTMVSSFSVKAGPAEGTCSSRTW